MSSWNRMSFRQKAEYLVDIMDGLTLSDVDDIYDEWSAMEFEEGAFGYDQALAALWDIAYQKSLKRLGHYEANQERINALVEQRTTE